MRIEEAISAAQQAVQDGKLTSPALENLMVWMTEARYARYQSAIVEHIAQGQWQKLDDVFWTIIPFGTGGRRGRMYEFGSNAINERTIGESAQGLAN
jgi:phosphoglucomutase/phosphomannomutase